MYCYRCGKELKDGAKFCSECGAEIENKELSKSEYVNYISNPNLNKNQESSRYTLKKFGVLLLIGGIISAFIVPAAVKQNPGTSFWSDWSYTYQWGSTFYMFIAGIIILAIILIIVAGKNEYHTICGQVVSDEDRAKEQHGDKNLTKKDFFDLLVMKSYESKIVSCGIVLYVLGVINIGVQIAFEGLPIEGILLILFGLGIHLGKSRICAILCTSYGAFNLIYTAMEKGMIVGWWILLIAIYALIYTFKYHSAWSQYQKDGTLPVEKK